MVMLRREGWQMNVKRTYRLNTEEGADYAHAEAPRSVCGSHGDGGGVERVASDPLHERVSKWMISQVQ